MKKQKKLMEEKEYDKFAGSKGERKLPALAVE